MTFARRDPFDLPEWHALRREAVLVSQLIGAGVTALGRASYGSGAGEYYTAFFGLSIGIERLAKLILVVDHALDNGGALPDQKTLKEYGHKLAKLVLKAEQIASRHNLSLNFPKPDNPISGAVISCLDAFADASKGRYANFEAIGNPSFDLAEEPVAKWWREVVEPILDKHYRGTRAERSVRSQAATIGTMLEGFALVRFFDEGGGTMSNIATASERSGQTKWAQKYGRFYTLAVVRWLSDIFSKLVHQATYARGIDEMFGHDEFFNTYSVDDTFLLTRKRWPLN